MYINTDENVTKLNKFGIDLEWCHKTHIFNE